MALRIPWEETGDFALGGGTYNGLDTRVGKSDSAGTKNYMRDGVGVTASVLSDSAAVYTPGVSERRGGTTTFLHIGLKNAGAQSSTSQAVTATRQYDAFGNVASSTGTWSGPFGYAGGFGYQEDPDTGLKLLGHRYYDSSTGRFLSRDTAKDGRNWYAYCAGNPVNRVDDEGRNWIAVIAVVFAIAGIVTLIIKADQFFKKNRQKKHDEAALRDNTDFDPGATTQAQSERLKEGVKDSAEILKDGINDNYVKGGPGEAGGDSVKVSIGLWDTIKEWVQQLKDKIGGTTLKK